MTYGQVASTPESRLLDTDVKKAAKVAAGLLSDYVTFEPRLGSTETTKGMTPDGGCFFVNGKLVLVVEAKKQNNAGNAIERWYCNNYIANSFNPDVSYITFAVGSGATETGVIGKTLSWAHPEGFNVSNHKGNACYLSVDGFETDVLVKTILDALDAHISSADGYH